jgi:hypothetical protein
MSSKIKKHQARKPRNHVIKQLIVENKGCELRDRRDRRAKEHKQDWKREAW